MQARLISILIHAVAVAALLLLPFGGPPTLEKTIELPLPPIRIHVLPVPLPAPGGGSRSPIPQTKGQLPLFAKRMFLPLVERPETVSPLMIEASIVIEMPLSELTLVQFGDPNAKPGPPSGGPGINGIGRGRGDGLGDGNGPGGAVTEGAGGSITGPVPIYKPDPEFSAEARKAKLQGQVVLEVVVDTDGKAHGIRIRSGLGLGLDEKAIAAVETWRFRPAHRNGRPIAVAATIYVNFRLL